jgi:hypothetical protein
MDIILTHYSWRICDFVVLKQVWYPEDFPSDEHNWQTSHTCVGITVSLFIEQVVETARRTSVGLGYSFIKFETLSTWLQHQYFLSLYLNLLNRPKIYILAILLSWLRSFRRSSNDDSNEIVNSSPYLPASIPFWSTRSNFGHYLIGNVYSEMGPTCKFAPHYTRKLNQSEVWRNSFQKAKMEAHCPMNILSSTGCGSACRASD